MITKQPKNLTSYGTRDRRCPRRDRSFPVSDHLDGLCGGDRPHGVWGRQRVQVTWGNCLHKYNVLYYVIEIHNSISYKI